MNGNHQKYLLMLNSLLYL